MRLAWLGAVLVTVGCATLPRPGTDATPSDSIRPAKGPFATRIPPATARTPDVWLEADRLVVLQGQLPAVHVFASNRGGQYRVTDDFVLLQPGGGRAPRQCDESRRPETSEGFAALSVECQPLSELGVYTVGVEPSRLGLDGRTATLSVRVISELPPSRPAPKDWRVLQLAAGTPLFACSGYGRSYAVAAEGPKVKIEELGRQSRAPVSIPMELAPRLSPEHAAAVRYVFETDDGWIVLFDHGELGGGVEWFAREGGSPRSLMVGPSDDDAWVPQNVNRAVAMDGSLYVLQGLSHTGFSAGQFAKIWREHGHFTSHVVARFASEPFDWIREADGAWLIATSRAIWRTSEDGRMELVTRLPSVVDEPSTFARTDDGTLYVGGRGGVLRLTPTWPDEPRYSAEFLIPEDREGECRTSR